MNNSGYEYPRESQEYVFFDKLTANGVTPANAEFSLSPGEDRPVVWKPTAIVNGRHALLLDGTLPAGEYTVWARMADNPELTVVEAGRIRLT